MSAPICQTHGEGFGSPCYLCVDAENRTLRALYAEAVRALAAARKLSHARSQLIECYEIGRRPSSRLLGHLKSYAPAGQMCAAVLSRPEAQAVLKEAPRG